MRLGGAVVAVVVLLSGLAWLPSVGAQLTTSVVQAVDVDLVGDDVWVTWSDGRVETRSFGSGEAPRLRRPLQLDATEVVVALVPSGTTGYWLVTSQGRVARAGDATDHGDLSAVTLNDPVVAAAPTASGGGYYMLGADGGVFTFGDAEFYGSVQGIVDEVIGAGARATDHLTAPIVALATTPEGYWLVAADGAVFPFGDAPYYGSIQDALNTSYRHPLVEVTRTWSVTPPVAAGAQPAREALATPIIDIVPLAAGYLLLTSDGGVFHFGQSRFDLSLVGRSEYRAVASGLIHRPGSWVLVTARGFLHEFQWG